MDTSSKPRQHCDVRVNICIGDKTYTATMFENPTANDLMSQLPLTLTFRDFGGQEKVSPLPHALTTQGVPKGDDPEINDIGYYAPSNSLVLYYSDVGYWDGIVRLGRFDCSIEAIRTMPDGFTATVERVS
jgi:hypothetical protein